MSAVAKQTRRPKPMTPFTLEHFKRYTSGIILDTGEKWELEPFQAEIVKPIFAGVKEVWAILPEGNAKTTLMAGVALYHCDWTNAPWVPIAASSRDQAEIMARQAYDMIRQSPGLLKRFRIYEGYREIRSRNNGGRGIKVYAADVMTADGVIPTLAICDEGHRHPDLELYRLWTGKLMKRTNARAVAQIVMISTAGEPGSEFEEARDAIRDRAEKRRRISNGHVRYEAPGLVMNEWKVARTTDATNMRKVKEANPLSTITVDDLREAFSSPTMSMSNWIRLKCNIPARSSHVAIPEQLWDARQLDEQVPYGELIDLGIDVAWQHDTTALQPFWRGPDYNLLGDPEIIKPPGDGSMLHPDAIKAAFDRIYMRNPVVTVVMDTHDAHDIVAWLEDERGVTVIDRPQNNASAADDYEAFMEALRTETLCHTGHSGLRAHVMHAIARALPNDRRRFDRPSQSRARKKQDQRVIDALTAAAMVNHYVMNPPEDDGYALAGELADYHIVPVG